MSLSNGKPSTLQGFWIKVNQVIGEDSKDTNKFITVPLL